MQLVIAKLDDYWDKFVTESPQGSIFSNRAFLEGSGYGVVSRYIKKGNHVLAAFCGILNGNDLVIAPHVIHGGLMFKPYYNQHNIAQTHALRFEITEFLIQELTKEYRNIAFNLHPKFIDIRPFQWLNYGTDKPKFKIDVRFTSCLQALTETQCNNTRRQILRDKNISIVSAYLPQNLIRMYQEMMGDKAGDTNVMYGIMESLYKAGKLRMFVASTNNEIGSIAAFGIHGNTAYNLYQAGKKDNCATHAIWEGIQQLAKDGISIVDLEGINSPKRGAFKLSFGGSVTPYYQVSLC